MTDKRCCKCQMLYEEDELLITEDTHEAVCPDCSGLLDADNQSCHYDEEG